jgi:MFS family permease
MRERSSGPSSRLSFSSWRSWTNAESSCSRRSPGSPRSSCCSSPFRTGIAAPRFATQKGPLPGAFRQIVAIFALFTLANSTDAFLLLRAQQAGLATWQLPIFWSFFQGVKAATGVPGGAVADRFGRVPAITLGWIVYAAAYAGFAYVSRPLGVWGLVVLYAVFYGLTEGSERAFVADLVPERLRGRAYGVFHAAIGITALPASVLFGLLWNRFSARVAFLTGATIALVSAALLWAATGAIRNAHEATETAAS